MSKSPALWKILVLALAIGFPALPAEAALITLDFTGSTTPPGDSNGEAILQTYGDGAGRNVSYAVRTLEGNSPLSDDFVAFWDFGYSDLVNVAWGGGTSGENDPVWAEVRIDPTAGFTIDLISFELGSWNSDKTTSWTVFDGAYSTLAEANNIVVDDVNHLDVTPNIAPSANGVVIQFQFPWAIAIDNIVFDVTQVNPNPIPEPSTMLMLSIGAAAAVRARRRRQSM